MRNAARWATRALRMPASRPSRYPRQRDARETRDPGADGAVALLLDNDGEVLRHHPASLRIRRPSPVPTSFVVWTDTVTTRPDPTSQEQNLSVAYHGVNSWDGFGTVVSPNQSLRVLAGPRFLRNVPCSPLQSTAGSASHARGSEVRALQRPPSKPHSHNGLSPSTVASGFSPWDGLGAVRGNLGWSHWLLISKVGRLFRSKDQLLIRPRERATTCGRFNCVMPGGTRGSVR